MKGLRKSGILFLNCSGPVLVPDSHTFPGLVHIWKLKAGKRTQLQRNLMNGSVPAWRGRDYRPVQEHLSKPQKCPKQEHADLSGSELPVTGKVQADAEITT